jgi:hypothetical protein
MLESTSTRRAHAPVLVRGTFWLDGTLSELLESPVVRATCRPQTAPLRRSPPVSGPSGPPGRTHRSDRRHDRAANHDRLGPQAALRHGSGRRSGASSTSESCERRPTEEVSRYVNGAVLVQVWRRLWLQRVLRLWEERFPGLTRAA